MPGLRQAALLRSNVDDKGKTLTAEDRERLLKPYLPNESVTSDGRSRSRSKQKPIRRKPIRTFLRSSLYAFVFHVMQLAFSIYLWIRRAYRSVVSRILDVIYHHHRTPELIQKDVKGFKKIPQHLSIILDLDGGRDEAAFESLIDNVCELAAWSACARIPTLSIYEKTGVLKSVIPQLHRQISSRVSSYYGTDNAEKPTVSLRAPAVPAFSPPQISPDPAKVTATHLSVMLLSESDGRRTLVDLTKTLAEMSQKHKLSPDDISTELIDAELKESVMDEPDLLILFGDSVILDGYPPWQIRLTEIFHVPDNHEVSYQVFLRGLQKYAGAQMRFGS